jgi:hypothetical protein
MIRPWIAQLQLALLRDWRGSRVLGPSQGAYLS